MEYTRNSTTNSLTISTPNDHQSAVVPCPFLFTTSGAMYSTVPQNENVFRSSTASLLRPKSTIGGGAVNICMMTQTQQKAIETWTLLWHWAANTDYAHLLAWCAPQHPAVYCTCAYMCVSMHVCVCQEHNSLLWFKVSIDNPQSVEMVQSQSQLCQIELNIFLSKHHLYRSTLNGQSSMGPGQSIGKWICNLIPTPSRTYSGTPAWLIKTPIVGADWKYNLFTITPLVLTNLYASRL